MCGIGAQLEFIRAQLEITDTMLGYGFFRGQGQVKSDAFVDVILNFSLMHHQGMMGTTSHACRILYRFLWTLHHNEHH